MIYIITVKTFIDIPLNVIKSIQIAIHKYNKTSVNSIVSSYTLHLNITCTDRTIEFAFLISKEKRTRSFICKYWLVS